jgi:septum formation protein
MHRSLILASSSEPRRLLLKRLQIPFHIVSPNVDETPLAQESPQDLVLRLAELKARTVAASHNHALIIGADQVGVLDRTILGKPLSLDGARHQLALASGKTLKFFIGLCLLDASSNTYQLALEQFDVTYRCMDKQMIENYLSKEQPLQCAGSCKAEGLGITLIESFSGTDFSALIGLPLIRLTRMLEHAGLNPLAS